MTNIPFRWILFPLVWLGGLLHSFAQNLVPNPSFEEFSVCPFEYGMGGAMLCYPWYNANSATSDYYNACSNPSNYGVPSNLYAYQEAHTGSAYAGGIYRMDADWREYIQVQLTEPLIAGYTYDISFFVSLADATCAIANIGMYISIGPPPGYIFTGPLNVQPQIEANQGFLNDEVNWMLISGCFAAQGGENTITIGNFYSNEDSPVDPDCSPFTIFSYYLIDDVSVTQGGPIVNSLDLELGDPVITCVPYEIDPGVTGVDFHWSNGSTDPTLIVTETGTYALTITSSCYLPGIDSVEVFFDGVPESVDLGPQEVTICNGDSYTISLDPGIGDYEWQDGSMGSNYSITTPGLYQVSFDDGCDVTTDEINVLVMDLPAPFSLGGDMNLCPGEEIEFSFDPDLGDFEWQDGSMSPDYIIAGGGIYELTISNMCGEYSDDVEVLEIPNPVIDLGPDQITICKGQTFDFNLDPDLGDYVWQDGSTSSTYSILIPGTYEITVTNECGSSSDSLEVILMEAPIFELPADQSLCPGQTVLIDGNGVSGNYLWQDSSTLSSFLATQAGTYSLTITNQCGSSADTTTVSLMDTLAVPVLGPDVSLCPGETFIFYSDVPGVNYMWQDSSTADSLVAMLPGTYVLQIANQCSTTSDTVIVTINDVPPVVDLPASIELCSADTIVIDAGISGVQYLWNDGSQLSSFTASDTGSYSITVSNACGADVDTVVIVDAGSAPSVSLNPDMSICPGEVVLLTPVSTDVMSWLWQDGSTASTYAVSSAGIIAVQVSNLCGIDMDTMQVSLLPSTPALDLGADTSLCPGETVTFSINIPGVDIIWPDGSSGQDYNVTSESQVYATISNQCGSSSDSLEVMLLPAAPTLNLGNDQSLCPGETIIISPGISDVDYLWQDGSTSPSFNATLPGIIILSVSNACGLATDTIEVIEDTDGPEVSLGEDIQACEGDVVTLTAGISGVDYLWQDGSTQPDFSTAVSGTFILQVSNACGLDADTVVVDLSGQIPTPSLGPDTVLCDGFILTLVSNADAETSIEWQDGSMLQVLNVSSPGTYILSEANQCGDAADTIFVAYALAPESFDLGPDTVLCPGEFILLNAPSTSDLITWQDGSHGLSVVADMEQTYSLTLSNPCGSFQDDLSVAIDEQIAIIHLDPEISLCQDEIITLDATQAFEAGYLWSNGSTLPVIQINTPGLYAINVTTACQSIQQDIEIVADENCSFNIYIPSVFSPNGDQVNDVFTVFTTSTMNVISMECRIFDRWGNNVLHTDEMNVNWDGRFRNEELMPGVYVYLIKLKFTFQGQERDQQYTGDITLVR